MTIDEHEGQDGQDEAAPTPPAPPPVTPPPVAGDEFELDLEVEDIQTRLPYGSEDIADK